MRYDVAVVGGSVAGSAAATLLARQGLRVAVLERRSDVGAYKKMCTHFVQPSAVPTLRRLGVAEAIEEAGGLRNRLEVWTRYGWVRDGEESAEGSYGYNIRRQKLDPLVCRLASETQGVDFMRGATADRPMYDRGRVVGVEVKGRSGRTWPLRARLVVAADGRSSRLAELTGAPTSLRANNRFVYFTYYRRLPLRSRANSQYWHLTPNLAYAFENDDETTLLGVFLPLGELREWKRDLEGSFRRFWSEVPEGPELEGAERISEMLGVVEMPNLRRRAVWKGMALVGDAALALDPIWGTGVGFAVQSAEWLAEAVGASLRERGDEAALDRGLARYHRRQRSATRGHALHIADFSRVRRNRWFEDLLLSGAVHDRALARQVLAYFGREIGLFDVARPSNLLRAARANLQAYFDPSVEPAGARARS